jgi:8-oxo-dGTP pyrophosphatase MutT (NUDIX family)
MVDALWRIGLRCAYRVSRVWWQLTHPDAHGAFVAVWHGDCLLLIRNSYRSAETVPCGGVGPAETPRQAARRELAEEVGIAASESELVGAGVYVVEFDGKRDHAHFFELRLNEETPIRVDRREVISGAFVASGELRERELVPHVRAYLSARSQSA